MNSVNGNTETADRIFAVLQSGEPQAAERMAREALEPQPDDPALLFLLAVSLQTQGRLPDALESYRRLTELVPGSASNWGNYGSTLWMTGDLQGAAKAYRRALEIEPRHAALLLKYGHLQLEMGEAFGARETLLKAHVLEPLSPLFRIAAARALCECRDDRAADMLARWRSWLPLPNDLHYELADLLQRTDWAPEAVGLLEDLLGRSPGHTQAKLLLAGLHERFNRLDAARSILSQLSEGEVPLTRSEKQDVARLRATLLARDGQLLQARTLLEGTGPRHASDASHYFQVGKLCDKLGDFAAAMRAFDTAHAFERAHIRNVAPQRLEPGAPILPAAAERIQALDYARWPQLSAPDAGQSPVFVVGFPRSGTTLIEQMLDAHPALQSMDERPLFGLLSDQLADHGIHVPRDLHKLTQHECDELRRGYLVMASSKVPRRPGAQLVDKNPLHLCWLPFIYRLFPKARFILALRQPCDAILSNYMQEYRSAVLAAAATSLERLALAYVSAMEHWQHHANIFKPDVLTVRYEELVVEPQTQAERIAAFLQLGSAAPLLNVNEHARAKGFIGTPSYSQVIEPINPRAIGRWRSYRDYFGPVLPILEPILERVGYPSLDDA